MKYEIRLAKSNAAPGDAARPLRSSSQRLTWFRRNPAPRRRMTPSMGLPNLRRPCRTQPRSLLKELKKARTTRNGESRFVATETVYLRAELKGSAAENAPALSEGYTNAAKSCCGAPSSLAGYRWAYAFQHVLGPWERSRPSLVDPEMRGGPDLKDFLHDGCEG